MEKFIPFILIVIGWNPERPADTMELQSPYSLYASQELCEQAGMKFKTEHESESGQMKQSDTRTEYKFFCVPAPNGEDYDSVFTSLFEGRKSEASASEVSQ